VNAALTEYLTRWIAVMRQAQVLQLPRLVALCEERLATHMSPELAQALQRY
jgi:hypothetical protein